MITLASTMVNVATSFGVPALVGGAVAGLFSWLAQRTKNAAPTEVSTSYSTLVADLEARIQRMEAHINRLELARDTEATKVTSLQTQVHWLLRRLPEDDIRKEFNEYFAGPRPGE